MNKRISVLSALGLIVFSTFLAFLVWLLAYVITRDFFVSAGAGFIMGILSGMVQWFTIPALKQEEMTITVIAVDEDD